MNKVIATHNAKFHADDVFAVAALKLLLGDEKSEIVRTRDEALIAKADYVVDVGGIDDPAQRRFDHHQQGGAGARNNGIPYASFGLVWKAYGAEICGSSEAADIIDRIMVQGIDSGDTGFDTFTFKVPDTSLFFLGDVVETFRPTWKEEDDWDNRFARAVEWATSILKRQIEMIRDEVEAAAIVRKVYESTEDKRVIIFDESHVFGREIITRVLTGYPEPIFAVLLRPDHGNWQTLAIRKEAGGFALRKPLPESWRAQRMDVLREVTGVADAVYCHGSGFMCVSGSKESAIVLANKALES